MRICNCLKHKWSAAGLGVSPSELEQKGFFSRLDILRCQPTIIQAEICRRRSRDISFFTDNRCSCPDCNTTRGHVVFLVTDSCCFCAWRMCLFFFFNLVMLIFIAHATCTYNTHLSRTSWGTLSLVVNRHCVKTLKSLECKQVGRLGKHNRNMIYSTWSWTSVVVYFSCNFPVIKYDMTYKGTGFAECWE